MVVAIKKQKAFQKFPVDICLHFVGEKKSEKTREKGKVTSN